MTIHWKKIPRGLQERIAPGSLKKTPRIAQDERSYETDVKTRTIKPIKGSFIVELEEKTGKFTGKSRKFI